MPNPKISLIVALSLALTGTAVQARDAVQFSLNFGGPVIVQSPPTYYQVAPIYQMPATVVYEDRGWFPASVYREPIPIIEYRSYSRREHGHWHGHGERHWDR